MGFTVEQECPQCGGTIELDETDHLIRCPYCAVSSFIANRDHFRFILPAKQSREELIYVPYLRFKGSSFSCTGLKIDYRLLDITHLGFAHPRLPASLGFRPQTLTMKFAASGTPGTFLPCNLTKTEALERITGNPHRSRNMEIFHRSYVGDSFSIIYLPINITKDTIHDMVTDFPLGKLTDDYPLLTPENSTPFEWHPQFLSTLCPQCGWNLSGERDSLVLFCINCDTAWEPGTNGFQQVVVHSYSTGKEPATLFLPFWDIETESEGIDIRSYADFLFATNQPFLAQTGWQERPMHFFSPAFKIRPKIYLQLGGKLTLNQTILPEGDTKVSSNHHPVNLAKSEAIQSLKIILASTTLVKKNIFPLLPKTTFRIKDVSLALIPFQDVGPGLYHEQLQINVNKNVLAFGRHL